MPMLSLGLERLDFWLQEVMQGGSRKGGSVMSAEVKYDRKKNIIAEIS